MDNSKKFKNSLDYVTEKLIKDMSDLENILSKLDYTSNPEKKRNYDFYHNIRKHISQAVRLLLSTQSNLDRYTYTQEMNQFLAGRIKTLEDELNSYRVIESLVMTDELDNILKIVKDKEDFIKKHIKE